MDPPLSPHSSLLSSLLDPQSTTNQDLDDLLRSIDDQHLQAEEERLQRQELHLAREDSRRARDLHLDILKALTVPDPAASAADPSALYAPMHTGLASPVLSFSEAGQAPFGWENELYSPSASPNNLGPFGLFMADALPGPLSGISSDYLHVYRGQGFSQGSVSSVGSGAPLSPVLSSVGGSPVMGSPLGSPFASPRSPAADFPLFDFEGMSLQDVPPMDYGLGIGLGASVVADDEMFFFEGANTADPLDVGVLDDAAWLDQVLNPIGPASASLAPPSTIFTEPQFPADPQWSGYPATPPPLNISVPGAPPASGAPLLDLSIPVPVSLPTPTLSPAPSTPVAPVPSPSGLAPPRHPSVLDTKRRPPPAITIQTDLTKPPRRGTVSDPSQQPVRRSASTGRNAGAAGPRSPNILEEDCPCRVCGNLLAVVVLRGGVDAPHTVEVACTACDPTGEGPITSPNPPALGASPTASELQVVASRKRRRGRQEIVECDVCRQRLGTGGVKVQVRSLSPSSPRSPSSPGRHEEEEKEEEKDFSVEIVCIKCRQKYAFCTEW
ncbi:hypothetical protein BDK51DRAFT_48215 [Blyttiomyces helicus]|uniref:Uncharacterized protein n=1 Tax=Blyttiomyces helicus TaxID=388810 RepID=A0A4P9W0J2_9FUNG|nr:hypothetical protein BDK51DRAFT_48215 [Blyttiomyces helicus]|eukprot:RKO84198.1 hypothetical protein BDK51DRAFT_48215 [Blyttiomyces helicus]